MAIYEWPKYWNILMGGLCNVIILEYKWQSTNDLNIESETEHRLKARFNEYVNIRVPTPFNTFIQVSQHIYIELPPGHHLTLTRSRFWTEIHNILREEWMKPYTSELLNHHTQQRWGCHSFPRVYDVTFYMGSTLTTESFISQIKKAIVT